MVQFGDQFHSQKVTQWSKFYVDYEGLKRLLGRMKPGGRLASLVPNSLKPSHGINTLSVTERLNANALWESVNETRRSYVRALSVTSMDNINNAAILEVDDSNFTGSEPNRENVPEQDADETFPLLSNTQTPGEEIQDMHNAHRHGWSLRLCCSCLPDFRHHNYEEEFLKQLQKELDKVNAFYLEKVIDYIDTLKELTRKIEALYKRKDKKGLWHLQQAFTELYRHEHLLQEYSVLNYTAFWKIIKKHDKQSHMKLKATFWEASIVKAQFIDTAQLEQLVKATERVFADVFYDGDIRHGAIELKLKRSDHTNTETYMLGYSMGLCLVLFVWSMIELDKLFSHDDYRRKHSLGAMSVYYSVGLLILLGWLYGGLVYVWTKHRINYVYLLGLKPSTRLNYTQVLREMSTITTVYLADMLLYFLEANGAFRPYLMISYPLVLFMWFFMKLLNPFKSGLYMTRAFVAKVLYQITIAPFGRCTFVDFFVADMLTSMAKVFTELSNAICFYGTGDFLSLHSGRKCGNHPMIKGIVSALPLWWRFCQCLRRYHDTNKRWPNLANAFKYSLSMLALLMGVFHPDYNSSMGEWTAYRIIWMSLFLASTLYSFWWDIKMDWGLAQPGQSGLRERRVYFIAMAVDLVLRFVWTLTLVPEGYNPFYTYNSYFQRNVLNPMLGGIELCRRAMWSVFRLEVEQLGNNTDSYREISSIPLKFDTTTQDIGETDNENKQNRYEIAAFVCVLGVLLSTSYFVDRV